MTTIEMLGLYLTRLKFSVLARIAPRTAAEKAFKLFCTPGRKSRMQTPSIFFAAEAISLSMNNRPVNGFRWSGRDRSRKALILHGFGSKAFKFHRFVSPLMQQGYEVVAFDAPAHGSSGGTSLNALDYMQMIELANDKFGPFDSYIAHSFGGLALSLVQEKKAGNLNQRLVLIAPATETSTAIDYAFDTLHLKNQKVRKLVDDVIYKYSGKKTDWFSVNRAIRKIKAPVLWVHDEDDRVTPLKDTLPTQDQHYPNVEFYITSGLGHKRIYHDKIVRDKIIDFLSQPVLS